MAVNPSGILSLPLHYLRLTIAGSSTFQTWVSAEDAAAALASVHAISVTVADDETITDYMPLAVVDWANGLTWEKFAGGERNHFDRTGDLSVLFRGSVDADHSAVDAAYTFTNSIGGIIDDMMTLAGTAGYLDITSITREDGPYRPDEDEEQTVGDYYEMVFRIGFQGL